MHALLQAVKAALRAGVDATGILTVVMTGEFTTNNSIQVTVRYETCRNVSLNLDHLSTYQGGLVCAGLPGMR